MGDPGGQAEPLTPWEVLAWLMVVVVLLGFSLGAAHLVVGWMEVALGL